MRRRLLDAVAVFSLLLCLIACTGMARSCWVMEQWALPPQPAPPLAGASYAGVSHEWVTQRFIESAQGQIRLIEMTMPVVQPLPKFGVSSRVRYYHRSMGDLYVNYTPRGIGFNPTGKIRVVLPGMEFSSVPAQVGPSQPASGPLVIPPPIVLSGFRSVSISWWLLAVLTGIFPVFRGRCRWLHYRRAWRVRQNLCAGCAYDLRESGGRCPECGLERAGPTREQSVVA